MTLHRIETLKFLDESKRSSSHTALCSRRRRKETTDPIPLFLERK
jgi:hypothetical protein